MLGMGHDWTGGHMASGVGGGQKIRLLRHALDKYKEKEGMLVMFTDS